MFDLHNFFLKPVFHRFWLGLWLRHSRSFIRLYRHADGHFCQLRSTFNNSKQSKLVQLWDFYLSTDSCWSKLYCAIPKLDIYSQSLHPLNYMWRPLYNIRGLYSRIGYSSYWCYLQCCYQNVYFLNFFGFWCWNFYYRIQVHNQW